MKVQVSNANTPVVEILSVESRMPAQTEYITGNGP